GILIKTADLDIPVVIDLVLDLDQTCIGDEIRARARLPVTEPGRINGRRQHDVRFSEIDDATRQTRDVGFIVTEIGFDDGTVVDMEVQGAARQFAIGRTFRRIAISLAVNDLEPITNAANVWDAS